MDLFEITALLAASAMAGVMNAIAGGGTVLTFPVLLFFGTPALVANATSTLALVLGTAGSIFGFRRQVREVGGWIWPLLPVSLIGGAMGSWLLTQSDERIFERLIPWLLLFASLLFLSQNLTRKPVSIQRMSLDEDDSKPQRLGTRLAQVFQLSVAVYGGYFGAGIGILMLASLGLMGMRDIHRMNAVKNVLASAINVVAAVWFVGAGFINWPRAGMMSLGAICGYFLGAHFSQKIPQRHVRAATAAIGLGISLAIFLRG